MSAEEVLQRGIRLYAQKRFAEAAQVFGQGLADAETSELWNDWAMAHLALGRPTEAEQGFCRALELNPANPQALANLGILMARVGREAEAVPLLERAASLARPEERSALEQACSQAQVKHAARGEPEGSLLEGLLRNFAGDDVHARQYFENQLNRYLVVLEILPKAEGQQRLLEVGSSFHHLTPAFKLGKGYDVTCTDLWNGPQQVTRRLTSRDGTQSLEFRVDNFDVQDGRWPYLDASFHAVLLCELLEHLSTDPMHVMAEINRVLSGGGLLLLTTPNIASARGVEAILKGESPYFWGQYEVGGLPTDHHNREWAPGEVVRLAQAAGFEVQVLRTIGGLNSPSRAVLRHLAAAGHPIGWRGEDIVLLARKKGAVKDRYPAEFYATQGTQAARRTHDS